MRYVIFVCLIFIFSIQSGKPIVGKWEGVDKYLIQNGDTLDFTLDGKGYFNNAILVFYEDNTGIELMSEIEFIYCFDEDSLVIGDRGYFVHEITEKELILIDALSNDLAYWSRFKRLSDEY